MENKLSRSAGYAGVAKLYHVQRPKMGLCNPPRRLRLSHLPPSQSKIRLYRHDQTDVYTELPVKQVKYWLSSFELASPTKMSAEFTVLL